MIIPQFSLRWLLGLTALCAGISLILSFAMRGDGWAVGSAAALGSVAAVAILHVAAFLGAWLVSQMSIGLFGRRAEGQSPFANKTVAEAPFEGAGLVESPMTEGPPPITG
ncbi:MAG TPA: hypothetical protein VFB80_14510 [Pirellulaceae bacterium]|nr:hypothetical protein [Pirellulaceae bacterium]